MHGLSVKMNPTNQLRFVVYPKVYLVLYPRRCRISSINSIHYHDAC